MPSEHERAGDDDQGVDDLRSQPPRRLLALGLIGSRQRRHERGAHRALGKEIAQEGRDAGGDDEGVGRVAGAEEDGLDDVADETEQAARERRQCR